jgi:hypothetical protein
MVLSPINKTTTNANGMRFTTQSERVKSDQAIAGPSITAEEQQAPLEIRKAQPLRARMRSKPGANSG